MGREITGYWVTDDHKLIQKTMHLSKDEQKKAILAEGKIPIWSYNETDYVKGRISVEVQLGKYSYVAYDLFVKHQTFFIADTIDLGIEIVPMKCMQKSMSSGPPYYEAVL